MKNKLNLIGLIQYFRNTLTCISMLTFIYIFGNCDLQIKLGSQYYFYMETQTALAVPDEDNCMVVYSSSQNPEYVHSVIARCLNIPEHNVRVLTRRVGGGFGGKALPAMAVSILVPKNLHNFFTFFFDKFNKS